MGNPTNKETLIAELASARGELSGYTLALRHDLDFGARLKRGVRAHPGAWFGGAAAAGLLLSKLVPFHQKKTTKLPATHRKESSSAGMAAFALTALKFGLTFAKPALLRWFNDYYGARKSTGGPQR